MQIHSATVKDTSTEAFGRPVIQLPRYLHAALLLALALCLLIGWAELYRAAQYINLLFLCYLLAKRPPVDRGLLWLLIAPTAVLLLLHNGATLNAEITKPIRHFWIASAIAVSIAMLDDNNFDCVQRLFARLVPLFSAIYLSEQLLFLLCFDAPFGASNNPHHLAYYSGLLLILVLYLINEHSNTRKLGIAALAAMLLALVAYSQSGAAVFALFAAALVAAALNCSRLFPQSGAAMSWLGLIVLTTIAVVGAEPIQEGWQSLLALAASDQRIGLWQDAWRMQQDASLLHGFIGHGAEAFVLNFTEYSRFHGIADFHSPHNSILEMLYAYGLIGVCVFLAAYCAIFFNVARGLRQQQRQRQERSQSNYSRCHSVYRLIAVVLVYNYVLISLTMPLYVHFNLYTLAYCCGTLYLLNKHTPSKPSSER